MTESLDPARVAGPADLLRIEHLSIGFEMYDESRGRWSGARRFLDVVHDLSISVPRGEIVAIVGASGSGKTILADAVMGLFARNALVCGDITYDGALCDTAALAKLRGDRIAFVPQSVNALDPLMKVGRQIGGGRDRRAELLMRYGLDSSVEDLYPFELSGGMARRVLLCTALISDPELIIADEPTPGLDLELATLAMQDFRDFADRGGSVLLITHDIELVVRVADRIAVFKDGTVVEEAPVAAFSDPAALHHPFSRMLVYALPSQGFSVPHEEAAALAELEARRTPPHEARGEGRRA